MIEVSGILMEDVQHFWPRVHSYVERALQKGNGEYLPCDIYESLSRGTMQLWVVADELELLSVFVTEIITFPRKRICIIVLAAGDGLDELITQIDVVEQWALDLGVSEVRIQGRKGWQRVLRSRGYISSHVVLSKFVRRDNESVH